MSRRSLGEGYEQTAAEFLKREGYEILERNFRYRQGEIDLIAREGVYLVFVEVKYRRDGGSGAPEEAVDRSKQRRICRTAAFYMVKHQVYDTCPCRFDVVAVEGRQIRLYRDAFSYCL
jgi:putative endonuclease